MIINVDARESELYKLLESNIGETCTLNKKVLPLGDIIICDSTGKELIIIERKTINDLASSIRDGRYLEQSFRLNNCKIHNHSIIYLIEGDFRVCKYTKVPKKTLCTAIFSLNYYKGFSVYRTVNLNETVEFILSITDKLNRGKYKHSFYYDVSNNYTKQYSEVIKRTKKSNITTENISEIMLSQIPGLALLRLLQL